MANTHPSVQNALFHADEIDLPGLIRALWREKIIIIIGCTVAIVMLAVLYLFWTPRTYEVRSIIKPAALRNLDQLNRSGIYKLSPKEALHRMETELSSYALRLEYLERNPQLIEPLRKESESFEQTFARFNEEAFKVLKPNPKDGDSVTYTGLSLTYPASIDGVTLLNGFMDYVRLREREQIQADVTAIISNRIKALNGKITAATASYAFKKNSKIAKLQESTRIRQENLEDELAALMQQLETRRKNRIIQLDEAIRIARQLNIYNPTTLSGIGGNPARHKPGSFIPKSTTSNSRFISWASRH